MKLFKLVAAAPLALLIVSSASAQLFSDNFESGLGQWSTVGSGYTTQDPFNASNNVLAFAGLGSGGDIFSHTLSFIPGQNYVLSTDYLGLGQAVGGVGGFLGIDVAGEHWEMGGDGYPAPVALVDDGAWHHYTYTFTAGDTSGDVKAEQFAGSPGAIPGNVFFDNVKVQAVPEPCSMLALGGGALALIRRRRAR